MKWPASAFLISLIVTVGTLIGYTQYLKYLLVLNHILPVTGLN